YSILTIGDGLISQIPALFISICAGMIVTRVSSDEAESNVGSDIGAQILSQPRAFLIGSVVMLGFGVIPGMPTATFLVLSAVVGILGYTFMRGERKVVDAKTGKVTTVSAMDTGGPAPAARKAAEPEPDAFTPTVPLLLDVPAA